MTYQGRVELSRQLQIEIRTKKNRDKFRSTKRKKINLYFNEVLSSTVEKRAKHGGAEKGVDKHLSLLLSLEVGWILESTKFHSSTQWNRVSG